MLVSLHASNVCFSLTDCLTQESYIIWTLQPYAAFTFIMRAMNQIYHACEERTNLPNNQIYAVGFHWF